MALTSAVTMSLFITNNVLASPAIISVFPVPHLCSWLLPVMKTCCQLVRHHSVLEVGIYFGFLSSWKYM